MNVYTCRKLDGNNPKDNQSNNDSQNIKKNFSIPKKIWIPITVVVGLAIVFIIVLIIYKKLIKDSSSSPPPPPNNTPFLENITLSTSHPEEEEEENDGIITPDLGPLKVEFSINTNLNDQRKIKVVQKSKEEKTVDGEIEENFLYRITFYDIIFFQEKKSEKYQEKYFNKTYTGSIAISSECFSYENEECEPQQFIDLNDNNISDSRNLEEINDLKDLPVPLCLFEMTDNDVIMSISCPESLSKGRKDTMVLDLYFFKPPSIERPNKGNGVNINVEQKNDKIYIRDTDIGKCSIKNPYLSNCTTDFNLTTDLEGNVLDYEELCFSNITSDESNIYIKNKITKLLDVTDDYNIDSEKYKTKLNEFLPLLTPYMKYDQLFNFSQFKKLYNTAKNVTSYNKRRNLVDNNNNNNIQKANLFSYNDGKNEYSINLNKNTGLGNDHFEFFNDFKVGTDSYNLVRLRENTNFNTILNKLSILSKAGNRLASNLYNNIISDFKTINDIIEQNITSLNNLIVYQDLLKLFDSSLSIQNLTFLPFDAVELSDDLRNGLDNIFNNILNEDLKNYIEEFKINIDNYVRNSHEHIFKIENNFKNLMSSLDSKKSILTEIATYYLNNTPESYSDTIIKVQNILMNYYKNENNSIVPKTERLLENFENNLVKSIQSETQKINNLLPKLEDNSTELESGTYEDSQKLIFNLKNSKNYIFQITNTIKEKIIKSLGLKDNNYFISNDEINLYENNFKNMINNALTKAQKLDNNEYIDKIFDNIMTNFKGNFTETYKNIDKIKEQIFTLTENNLKNDYFTSDKQKSIYSDIRDLYVQISLKINRENEFYISTLQKKLDDFVKNNKENLKKLINEIMILFSEEKLEKLSNLYNKGFKSSLQMLENTIEKNNNLAKNYYKELKEVILNDKKIASILYDYKQGNLPYTREYWSSTHYVYLRSHQESISSRKLTQGYLTKYNKFKTNLGNSLDYIKNSIFLDFLNEYKNIIIKLKQLLQTIKNTKISDLYPDFLDLKFTDDNIEKIDILYTRLNKYISDIIFNENYISKINQFKTEQSKKVQDTKNYVEEIHEKINYDETINDLQNDFCYSFKTKAFYTCTNGQLSYYVDSNDYYCLHLSNYSENYNEVEDISIYDIEDIKTFINQFKTDYSLIEEKVNSYDSIMKDLRNNLSSVKELTIEQNITKDYLLSFKNYINDLLSEKYDDNIIIGVYDHYKNDTKTKIEDLLDNIGDKWEKMFDSVNNEIEDNINNISSGTFELGIMEQITATIIKNITTNFFKSIINHQKNEFSYTISYYYNYLLRILKSSYKYILNGIHSNKNGFNDIINLRKDEINQFFSNLIEKINGLKEKSCSTNKQKEVLQINEENFFDINDVIGNNINKTIESLNNKATYPYDFDKENNEYSFINRFYLENSLIGKQLKELFKEIEENNFIRLKVDEFINLINENFLFDKNEYKAKIEEIINNLELNIQKSFLNKEKDYISDLEEKIKEVFTKDRMIQEINDLYKKGITELQDTKIQEINNNINDILNKIKQYISSEANRLKTTLVFYTNDYSIINKTLNDYKNKIYNQLNITFMSVLEEFHLEIRQKLLKNYVEEMLDLYLNKTITFTSISKVITTLNNTYNTSEIMINIVKDLYIEYKNITEMQIENKYQDYAKEIRKILNLDGIKIKIDNEIQNEYNLILLEVLKEVAIYKKGEADYHEYDFNDDIKDEIKKFLEIKINTINDIILTTKGYEIKTITVNNTDLQVKESNFKITLPNWENSFDDSLVYYNIENSIENLISNEKIDEVEYFKNNIKDFCISNFNELLSEIILSFGKDFFDRIIQYNDNFKITGLYNNLKYSIFQTISYYIMINLAEEIKELPRDLKSKLYSLNNIDLIAKEKNNKVLKILNSKIDEFINQSKEKTITLFISKIQEYIIKENYFNYEINEILKETINNLREENIIVDNYISLLNNNFKYVFNNSFTNSMNRQLNELIELVYEQKEALKAEIDYCFTLEPEEVLNEINNKINITLESVEEYNNKYYDGFVISIDFVNYLNNYGTNKISPLYKELINLLDDSTRNIILNNIDKNIRIYEDNLNINKFNELSNKTHSLTKEISENIKNFINIYGIEEYKNNLNNEIEDINLRNIRRLNGEMTKKDIEEEKNNEIDKGISEIFNKLLGNSENLTIFMESFEEFNNFKNNISYDLDNLDESFKKSKRQIIKNNYEEEITNNLTEKLSYLKNISSDYYYSLNETFFKLKDYLNNTIFEIYDLLNQSENITYKTFSEQYEKISKEVKTINKEYDNNIKHSPITHNSSWENNNLIATAEMNSLQEKGKFNFFYKYEKGSSPIMRVELIDECKPEDLALKIEEQYGDCGKNVEKVDAKFKDVNVTFITYIDYNIILNQINMTTITNFDSYDYDVYKYKTENPSGPVCKIIMGTLVCTGSKDCKEKGGTHKTLSRNSVSYNNTVIFTP